MHDLSIRWALVKERLTALQSVGDTTSGGEDVQRILEERALALANPERASHSEAPPAALLVFSVGGVRLALRNEFVREVIADPILTRVWKAPRQLLGLCSVRGTILPVFDILAVLGLTAESSGGRLVVVVQTEDPFGFIIDEAKADRAIPPDLLAAPGDQPFVEGIAECGTLLLDGAALCGGSDLFL